MQFSSGKTVRYFSVYYTYINLKVISIQSYKVVFPGKTYFFKGNGFWKFNDLHMRVEHIEPKLSAPFWMGCSTNYEENGLGQKLPYIHGSSNKGIRKNPSTTIVVLILVYFYFNVFT